MRTMTPQPRPIEAAGVWGIAYVRGAMDPQFATPKARDEYVQVLLGAGDQFPLRTVAAEAFMRGWVEHHKGCSCTKSPAGVTTWSLDCTEQRHRVHARLIDLRDRTDALRAAAQRAQDATLTLRETLARYSDEIDQAATS